LFLPALYTDSDWLSRTTAFDGESARQFLHRRGMSVTRPREPRAAGKGLTGSERGLRSVPRLPGGRGADQFGARDRVADEVGRANLGDEAIHVVETLAVSLGDDDRLTDEEEVVGERARTG
jgi:hypothetical protein